MINHLLIISGAGQYSYRYRDKDFLAGTLDQAHVYGKYLDMDAQGNLFMTWRDGGSFGIARINEKENIVYPFIFSCILTKPLCQRGDSGSGNRYYDSFARVGCGVFFFPLIQEKLGHFASGMHSSQQLITAKLFRRIDMPTL
ncbi:Uncharacterised protein [Sphingobacterium multivorum]|uniref:Uncharacterized protein n=1 Tax=Sphingobacterium multivorum TaxID=28454 RepID=A0A2X2ISK2_SPHMU|nr:hypothetical protein [Sphingobacterium multivorum]SPZ84948.1 Uncharacterised protein [Sphingobacterium multivorum]